MSMHVIIAGGGIGGLALAQKLRRNGVEVTVHEREHERTDRLQGYRIHISPHGSRALHECLPPALFDAVVASGGHGGNEFGFVTEQMGELLHLGEDITTGGRRAPEHGHHGVSRITLRKVLLTGLDDVVRLGSAFERYEHEPDGRVTAHLADGTSTTGDVLVGADGGRSRVRAQLLPGAGRVETGIVTIAGKLMLTEENREWAAPHFLAGPLSVIPPRGGGMFIAPHELDGPPAAGSSRDPLFDDAASYVFWAFAARRESYPGGRPLETLDGAALRELALTMTAGWSPVLRRLVGDAAVETVTLLPIRTAEPVTPWETTNVTLLGDAIHSMTPFRGIGANTALRDAAALGQALVAVDRGERSLIEALHGYEADMIDYGFEAVRTSLAAARQAVDGGRAARTMARTVFRTANAVPALKRKMFAGFGDA